MNDEEPTSESAPFDLAAPITFGDRIITHDFPSDLLIGDNLEVAAKRQPELFANYGMLAVEARHRERQMRLEMDRVISGVEAEIRQQLAAMAPMIAKAGGGAKRPSVPRLSAGMIKAQVMTDERVRRKETAYLAAAREAEKLTLFEEALRQRGAALGIIAGERARRR